MLRNIHCVKRRVIAIVLATLIVSASSILSGCGNKGDLYLPDAGSSTNDSTLNKTKKN